jgi:tetratricopeptide (TPR) repeat protein
MSSSERAVFVLDKISFTSFLATIFLLPVFFIPFFSVSLHISKGFLLAIGMVLALLSFLVARIIDGQVSIPKNRILLWVFLIAAASLIAGLFSSSRVVSMLGSTFEIGTFSMIAVLAVALTMSSIFSREKGKALMIIATMFASFALVAVFQTITLFVDWGRVVPADFFIQLTDGNLVGKLNDLGIFFSLMIILSFLFIDYLEVDRPKKIALWIGVAISVIYLTLINFKLLWVIFGIVSLKIFLRTIISRKESQKFPLASFIVVIASILVLLGISSLLKVKTFANLEVRPSLQATWVVAQNTLAESPVIGSGLNRFDHSWFLFKPLAVNYSKFWNIPFSLGSGLIPTFLVTSGILGGLAWLAFLFYFIWVGIKLFFGRESSFDPLLFIVYTGALYLWAMAFLYTPSIAVYSLAFILTGIFVGLYPNRKQSIKIDFVKADPRKGFLAISMIVILVLGTVTSGYLFTKKFSSIVFFERANRAFASDNLPEVERRAVRAIDLSASDHYFRFLSEIYFSKFNSIISAPSPTKENLTEANQFLDAAVTSAQKAILYNKTNYLNWQTLAQLYQALVPIKVQGAYESSINAYREAFNLNPNNPELYLAVANLELARGNETGARLEAARALEQKFNYTEALTFLAEIELRGGNVAAAIGQMENAAKTDPNNPLIFFQLGLIKYQNLDYSGALPALERAVLLKDDYANARYFLALTYERLGMVNEALGQLRRLSRDVPNNEEITKKIESLERGIYAPGLGGDNSGSSQNESR